MPAFSPKGQYTLTSTQIDLIIYALNRLEDITVEEDNERGKIMKSFKVDRSFMTSINDYEDPYAYYCDI